MQAQLKKSTSNKSRSADVYLCRRDQGSQHRRSELSVIHLADILQWQPPRARLDRRCFPITFSPHLGLLIPSLSGPTSLDTAAPRPSSRRSSRRSSRSRICGPVARTASATVWFSLQIRRHISQSFAPAWHRHGIRNDAAKIDKPGTGKHALGKRKRAARTCKQNQLPRAESAAISACPRRA
jgi:hypothetical protein